MKWLKRAAIILGLIVLVLAVVPFFISLDDYIPQIEQAISARIQEPVKIGSLRAAVLPVPHLVVGGIRVGKGGDVTVGKVTVTPDLWSLLGETKVIRSIEIDQLVLTQKAFDKMPVWVGVDAKPDASGRAPAVRVESIRLDDAVVKLRNAAIGPFDARLRLKSDGAIESASFVNRDGTLKARIIPQGSNYLVEVAAKGWMLPAGPALRFDELAIKGVATLNEASFSEVRARLYGGTIAGRISLGWQKGMQIKGDAEVSEVEIRQLLRALGKPQNVSGKLNARPVFSASAARPEQIADALRLETPFDVQDGVLYGMDIRKAATSLISKNGGKGGETRFDTLSGRLAMERGTRRLTELKVVSGSLSAEGEVTISPKDELSGRIRTTIGASSVASASVPLNVGGTLDLPLLYPTGGTVAGAAAGTAVLGPGLGTALGARIGQWTEGLFGKKEKKQ